MKNKTWILLFASTFSLLLSGCEFFKTKEIDKAKKAGILLVGIGPDPETLDPQCATGVTEQNVLRALFEGLVKPHPETIEPRPGVAKRWSISEDGLIYTFYLRKNAHWSNGDPLTAEDFVFSFQRLLTQEIASPGATSFFTIKNAKAFYHKNVSFDEVGVKAINSHVLQITLEKPTPYFLSLLMQTYAYPLHHATLKKCNGEFTRDPSWTREQFFVSNGAFRLKQWKTSECIDVYKNENYWNKNQVKLNGIKFKPIADVTTEERAFRSHQLHITENVPYTKLKTYHEKTNSPLQVHDYLGTFYYIFNTKVKPLDDVRVRKALNLALSRNLLMGGDLFNIKHKSTFQLVPEGCQNFHCQQPLHEDGLQARQLLAEAGYPNGQNFPKLTLTFNLSEGQMYLAAAIQEMWKRVLNINIELVTLEWKVYLKYRREKNFEIARGGWIGDYNDPTTFLDLWLHDSPNNYTNWQNAKFDDLLAQAAQEPHAAKRIHLLEEAENILLEEVPLLPLHASATSHLVHPSVKNWFANLLDWHPYDCIYLE